MSLTAADEAPPRARTRKRDEDLGDVWWECGTAGCPLFFGTPHDRERHEAVCEPEVEPWD